MARKKRFELDHKRFMDLNDIFKCRLLDLLCVCIIIHVYFYFRVSIYIRSMHTHVYLVIEMYWFDMYQKFASSLACLT